LDVVSMRIFYSGPRPAGGFTRLREGLRECISNRVEVVKKQTGVHITIQELPGRLEPVGQDLWAYHNLKNLLDQYYDLCIFGNPKNVLLPLLLKKRGVVGKVIYDDWDDYTGFYKPLTWTLLMGWRERLCISMADVVISVGSLLAELRKKQGAVRTIVVPNGVDYSFFAEAQQQSPHPPTLIYVGILAEEYGLDISIEGFSHICKEIPSARYYIIGEGHREYVDYLQSMVSKLGLDEKVIFWGYRQYKNLPTHYAEADIGVALFKPSNLMKYAYPLKVVEYMAAGLAVVGTKIGETERLILDAQSGEVVMFTAEAFSAAVVDMLNNNVQLRIYRENAKEYSKGHDWNKLFARLLNDPDLGFSS